MRYLLILTLFFLVLSANGQADKLKVAITSVTTDFYVHTSFKRLNNVPFPSNGLIIDTNDGVVLVDTGWGIDQTSQILQWVDKHLKKEVTLCIITHFHDDRTGGISVMKSKGIRVVSTAQTADQAVKDGFEHPEGILPADTVFSVGNKQIHTFYPGEGHSKDNIVVWFPQDKVLFGGCFVKSVEATSLGNVADANLMAWPQSLQKVIDKFQTPAFIIPGHQAWKSTAALQHTLELLKSANK